MQYSCDIFSIGCCCASPLTVNSDILSRPVVAVHIIAHSKESLRVLRLMHDFIDRSIAVVMGSLGLLAFEADHRLMPASILSNRGGALVSGLSKPNSVCLVTTAARYTLQVPTVSECGGAASEVIHNESVCTDAGKAGVTLWASTKARKLLIPDVYVCLVVPLIARAKNSCA
jgi:hypothetical protein